VRAVSLVWPLSASTQRPSGSLMTPVGPSSPEASSRLGAAAPEPTPVIRRSSPWSHWPRRRRSPPPPGRRGQGQRDRVRHERDQLGLHPAWPGASIRGQGDDRCRRSVERRPAKQRDVQRAVRAERHSGRDTLAVAFAEPARGEAQEAGDDADRAGAVNGAGRCWPLRRLRTSRCRHPIQRRRDCSAASSWPETPRGRPPDRWCSALANPAGRRGSARCCGSTADPP
jgi:hypothetical protein